MELYRAATLADINQLVLMNQHLMEDEGYRTITPADKLEKTFNEWFRDPRYTITVPTTPEDTSEILGYVVCRNDPEFTYINHFFIARNARKSGVGSRLIQEVEKLITPEKPMRLNVLHQNKSAQKFYDANGYRIFGFTPTTLILQKFYGH